MKKAALFEKRISNWAKTYGVAVKEMDYIDSTNFYYIVIETTSLYWRELRTLEGVCIDMGILINEIAKSNESNETWTIWLCPC